MSLRAELLFALRLRVLQILLYAALAVGLYERTVVILDDGDAVRLTTLLGVLNYLD